VPAPYEACKNCGCDPELRAQEGRGYCTRCYPFVNRIAHAKVWNRKVPETLKGMPKHEDNFSEEKFEIFRRECIRQFKERLGCLRVRQEMRDGVRHVKPLDLEHKLAKLLREIRPNALYPRNASYLAKHFGAEERRVMYGLLDDIEDHVRWKFLWHKVYERMRPPGDQVNHVSAVAMLARLPRRKRGPRSNS
jgi:hypothetical protein